MPPTITLLDPLQASFQGVTDMMTGCQAGLRGHTRVLGGAGGGSPDNVPVMRTPFVLRLTQGTALARACTPGPRPGRGGPDTP